MVQLGLWCLRSVFSRTSACALWVWLMKIAHVFSFHCFLSFTTRRSEPIHESLLEYTIPSDLKSKKLKKTLFPENVVCFVGVFLVLLITLLPAVALFFFSFATRNSTCSINLSFANFKCTAVRAKSLSPHVPHRKQLFFQNRRSALN